MAEIFHCVSQGSQDWVGSIRFDWRNNAWNEWKPSGFNFTHVIHSDSASSSSMGREKSGFHGFRRYRIAHLRTLRVMEGLSRIWVGHSTHGITDNHTVESLKADAEFRRKAAQETGLGFHIPVEPKLPVAPNAPELHSSNRFNCLKELVGERGFPACR